MTSPKIVNKTFEKLLEENVKLAKTNVKEWNLDADNEKDPGACLIKLFTHMQEDIGSRINRVPDKNLKAFLDMLGITISSSQPARAPITFYPTSGFPDAIYIPQGTPLAAPMNDSREAVGFETEKGFSVCDSNLSKVLSIDPMHDEIFDHLSSVQNKKPFKPFRGQNLQQHVLYLGHRHLFRVEGSLSIILEVTFNKPDSSENLIKLKWEYVNDAGKTIVIKSTKVEYSDNKKIAKITLTPSGKIKETEINGKSSLWISARTENIRDVVLPAINKIKILGISSDKNSSKPDFAFCGFIPLDLSAEKIYPLGREPKLYDSFSMSCKEVLSKSRANIKIVFSRKSNDPPVVGKDPSLLWEYFDGTVWKNLHVIKSEKFDEKFEGTLEFECPSDLSEGEVHGINGFWVRATLIEGDWGKEKLKQVGENEDIHWVVDKSDIKPPWLSSIELQVKSDLREGSHLECCMAYNNLDYVDLTVRSKGVSEESLGFMPFVPLLETNCVLYLGFDNRFPDGNTSTYFSVDEASVPVNKEEVKWSYWLGPVSPAEKMSRYERVKLRSISGLSKGTVLLFCEQGKETAMEGAVVKEISSDGVIDLEKSLNYLYSEAASVFHAYIPVYLDNTDSLNRSDMLEFTSLEALAKISMFGSDCYWMGANLLCKTRDPVLPIITGIYPNTVWASQFDTVLNEMLGSSSGEKSLSFAFNHRPIISSEVWVREGIILTESDIAHLAAQKIGFVDVTDNLGKVVDAWIRWKEVDDLYGSGPHDRHYLLDAANGKITFGDGIDGMIPPIGSQNIKVNYKWGGGLAGNLLAGNINVLEMPIAGVERIVNHIASEGGSEMESMSDFLERGQQQIRHRDRAVTLEDYARIAETSHSSIARIKCMTKGGKIHVIVIPAGPEDRPMPSQRLLLSIKSTLESKSQISLPSNTLNVQAPIYKEVRVAADIVPVSIDLAVPLKKAIIERLHSYLHPLIGGPGKGGWAFGRGVYLSEIYSLIQGLDGVAYVENLTLNDKKSDVLVDDFEMVCSGNHVLTVKLEA
ncbi:MAG: putative baseplate assembly protein [Methanothrix sp.]|nr:MAG: putative baseplate assembly protein [Methanothrix sp.]